jgi:ParB-like chromosome segregation protein Spo0J
MNNVLPDLESLRVPLERVSPLPGNPRRGDIDAVAASLEMFGQHKPIVVRRMGKDKKGNDLGIVLAGNHTLAAATQLKWDSIAVVWTDDDDVFAKARALADNHTAELGSYDDEALAAMLADVATSPELLAAISFPDQEIARLLHPPSLDSFPDAKAPGVALANTVKCPACGFEFEPVTK